VCDTKNINLISVQTENYILSKLTSANVGLKIPNYHSKEVEYVV